MQKRAHKKQKYKPSFPRTKEEANQYEYKFWKEQPVAQLDEKVGRNELIDSNICENVSDKSIDLPEGYSWTEFDANNKDDLQKMTNFLEKYYVEDISGDFRLNYSPEFLSWALLKPNSLPICLGVEVEKTGLLVGMITSVTSTNQVYTTKSEMAEIDFLCVHPKVRNKRLTPVLINEISRRLKLQGLTRAMYTAASYLPKPFTTLKFYHRPIQMEALVETGFTKIRGNISMADVKRNLALPKKVIDKFIKLEEKYVEEAFEVLNNYFDKYTCHPIFTLEEFKYMFLNNDFVTSYVVLDDNKEYVVDFISYYKLPSKVINEKKNRNYPQLNAAYLFYYSSNVETIFTLLSNMLIVARDEDIHVFNAFDAMENMLVLDDLKFEQGTGSLHYYMYNYRCVEMDPTQVAKFLL